MTISVSDAFKADLTSGRSQRENTEFAVYQANPALGVLDVWGLLKRRFRTIAAVVLGCTLLATIASFTLPKTYTATSGVVLERKDVRPFATDASLQSLERDRSAAETEMDILQSRQFAGRVVDRLDLVNDPSFNPYARSDKAAKRNVKPAAFLLISGKLSELFDHLLPRSSPQRLQFSAIGRSRPCCPNTMSPATARVSPSELWSRIKNPNWPKKSPIRSR